ncbi:para-aminobenzoate synthetase component 1 [Persephonella hydrogeniphila]|uniref:Para-aminobenzoate synthetase component 1 n=1 Tax=Persephonella hydrogeniphila TaxID=198703 RepID=A0A285N884_9AQUI|nr:anthranilate synthase component I family protein [Persephonella hydrogeniphila]SNZ03921.1 para-aminobenzoate synthetase component 1 [Persephonella hydrogeniphila]
MKFEFYSDKEKWIDGVKDFSFENPVSTAYFDGNILFIDGKKIKTKDPLPLIEKYIKKHRYYGAGFISYDYKKYIYPESIKKKRDIGLPLIFFSFFRKFKKGIKGKPPVENRIKSFHINETEESFVKKVLKAKKFIEQGDIYQINLSHRIELEGFFHTDTIFRNLISYQPASYLMHIKTPYFSVISGSMELFLEKKGKNIKTSPIKGTRPVGKNREETEKLKNELFCSEKERAENLMITDLMRNDLGRISEKGSVKVENLFDVEEYSSLLQMSSTVRGRLIEGITLKNIIHSTFPPGSVTGAPKKRAIEIIDMIEKKRREVYCGITVLITPDMDFVMSVAIRQSIFKNNRCYVYVGSGIVADSDPYMEYRETLLKAKANLKAIGLQLDIL